MKMKLRAKLPLNTRIWAMNNGDCFIKNQFNPKGFKCSQVHAKNLFQL